MPNSVTTPSCGSWLPSSFKTTTPISIVVLQVWISTSNGWVLLILDISNSILSAFPWCLRMLHISLCVSQTFAFILLWIFCLGLYPTLKFNCFLNIQVIKSLYILDICCLSDSKLLKILFSFCRLLWYFFCLMEAFQFHETLFINCWWLCLWYCYWCSVHEVISSASAFKATPHFLYHGQWIWFDVEVFDTLRLLFFAGWSHPNLWSLLKMVPVFSSAYFWLPF